MRAIAAFFLISWGTIAGLVFAGMFISMGHPTGVLNNVVFACASVLFSCMSCIGLGRFIDDAQFGKILALVSGIVITIVFVLRIVGVLPN
ncbi:MAG: hypothetical protein K2Z81_27565 [Cyanobacteria bacterium]|nr:hypothetical protein [Cyanobacteriota bacterium]